MPFIMLSILPRPPLGHSTSRLRTCCNRLAHDHRIVYQRSRSPVTASLPASTKDVRTLSGHHLGRNSGTILNSVSYTLPEWPSSVSQRYRKLPNSNRRSTRRPGFHLVQQKDPWHNVAHASVTH